MHIFLNNFHQCLKYISQISSHQAELRIDGNFTDQEYLSIASLQADYFSLDRSSGSSKNIEKSNLVQKKCTFCAGANHSAELFFKDKKI